MIIRRGEPKSRSGDAAHELGAFETVHYSDAGGLTQFGAYVETLEPGSRSSERHWHEQEDEFLYLLAGEATVLDNDYLPVPLTTVNRSPVGGRVRPDTSDAYRPESSLSL